jgi:ribosomal protein L11 methyltransferase
MEDAQAVVTAAVVDDEDWANNWKAYFKPFRVTSRLTIKPTWETYERTDGAEQIIELDPAMAFGTGAHPTTSLSLGLLQDVIQGGEDLIDVGTGSGILAIGALKLGAGHVLALDLDPLAVKAATENAALNGYDQEQIDVRLSDLLGVLQETERAQGEADVPPLHVQLPVDIVVANILAEIIISFVDDVYQALRIGGKYIVSGVIDSRREVVLDALTAGGFTIDEVRTSGDWIAILAHK